MTRQPGPVAGPAVFVLFGATGDLARRMVLPALYRLACEGLLPRQWLLVGNGRGEITHENFRARVHDALTEFGSKPEGTDWDSFAQRVFFAGGGFSPGNPGALPDVLGRARASLGGGPQLVHYLAVPPVAFGGLTLALGQYGLAGGARVVYEKPFGTSPGSFRELDRVVHSVLDEQQVYRIDHFLGKEATQDLHVLRFANSSSAAYWDREHVESVQVDVPETLGISDRAQFYDARLGSSRPPRAPRARPGVPAPAKPSGRSAPTSITERANHSASRRALIGYFRLTTTPSPEWR